MNILVVDDIALNRKLLRAQLEGEGFSVIEAGDGIEALTKLADEAVAAVISDILMPRMDGYRFCREVRKDPAFASLKFILYSSTYTSPADVHLSNSVGADQFIAKPASIEKILEALQPNTKSRPHCASDLTDEVNILQQYSAVLVAKLEVKNAELQKALDASQCAHCRIQELNTDLERRVRERTADLETANINLTTALADVKQLTGLLPICSYCKSIRDDGNYWDSVEGYLTRHTESKFSHGICPDCYTEHVTKQLKDLGIASPEARTGTVPTVCRSTRHPFPTTRSNLPIS